MTRLWLTLPSLALALLGAHFYRAGQWLGVAGCALLFVLPWLLTRPWVARLVQVALAAGALEWLWTAFTLVQARQALGQPWLRLALILGTVALLTASAALVFRRRALRERFGLR